MVASERQKTFVLWTVGKSTIKILNMQKQAKVIVRIQGLLMISVIVSPFFDGTISNFHLIPQSLSQVIGSLMAIIGVVLNFLAIQALGKSFTIHAIPKAEEHFIAKGIFHYTRNPMYLGGLLMSFGWATSLHSPLTFIAAVLLALNLYYKIFFEEKQLKLKFGAPYETYMANVKRLVPFLF